MRLTLLAAFLVIGKLSSAVPVPDNVRERLLESIFDYWQQEKSVSYELLNDLNKFQAQSADKFSQIRQWDSEMGELMEMEMMTFTVMEHQLVNSEARIENCAAFICQAILATCPTSGITFDMIGELVAADVSVSESLTPDIVPTIAGRVKAVRQRFAELKRRAESRVPEQSTQTLLLKLQSILVQVSQRGQQLAHIRQYFRRQHIAAGEGGVACRPERGVSLGAEQAKAQVNAPVKNAQPSVIERARRSAASEPNCNTIRDEWPEFCRPHYPNCGYMKMVTDLTIHELNSDAQRVLTELQHIDHEMAQTEKWISDECETISQSYDALVNTAWMADLDLDDAEITLETVDGDTMKAKVFGREIEISVASGADYQQIGEAILAALQKQNEQMIEESFKGVHSCL